MQPTDLHNLTSAYWITSQAVRRGTIKLSVEKCLERNRLAYSQVEPNSFLGSAITKLQAEIVAGCRVKPTHSATRNVQRMRG